MKHSHSSQKYTGLIIGWTIILFWMASTAVLLFGEIPISYFLIIPIILIQTHLSTGLFITGHDAMHGLVSTSEKLNSFTGRIALLLFAFNSYDWLLPKHHEHHKYVATSKDPDYHPGSFIPWYFGFLREYVGIGQILAMAVSFNILIRLAPAENVIYFWVVPSILSTLQLFFFGTFLPHRGIHDPLDPYKAKSQKKNHIWAFFSCYFFGYHQEHHRKPFVPWWKLYRER